MKVTGLADVSTRSHHIDSNVSTTTDLAANLDQNMVQHARSSADGDFAGYIFMCNTKTKPDCFTYRVFGLPAPMIGVVEKIKPNTKLFLYDFEVKLLYGLYVADSIGTLALEPNAFGGRFPAQVKFSIAKDCLPLPMAAFKDAINYTGTKFKQDLSYEQVNKLVSLFRPITVLSPHEASLSFHNAAIGPLPDVLRHPGSRYAQEVPLRGLYSSHSQIALTRGGELASDSYAWYVSAHSHQAYHSDDPDPQQHDTRVGYGHIPKIGLSTVVPSAPSADSYYGLNERRPAVMSSLRLQAMTPSSARRSSSLTSAQWVAMASNAPNLENPIPSFKQSSSKEPRVSRENIVHGGSDYTEPVYDHQNLKIGLSTVVPSAPSADGYYGLNERRPAVMSSLRLQAMTPSSARRSSSLTAAQWVAMASNAPNLENPIPSFKQSSSKEPRVSRENIVHGGSDYTEPVYDHQNLRHPNTQEAASIPTEQQVSGYIQSQGHSSLPVAPQSGSSGVGCSIGADINVHENQLYGAYHQNPPSGVHQEVPNVQSSVTPSTYAAPSYISHYTNSQVTVPQGNAGYGYENQGYAGYYQASSVTADQGVNNVHASGVPAAYEAAYYGNQEYPNPQATIPQGSAVYGYENQGYTSYYQASVTVDQGLTNDFPVHAYEHPPASITNSYVQNQGVPALPQTVPSGNGVVADNAYYSYYHHQVAPITSHQEVNIVPAQVSEAHPTL